MRAIKKIVALATGATMLGATIMGAMAADLADYPAPYVTGCDFSGAIVVGESAAAEDVVGAIDIASSLAVSGTSTTTTGTETTITISGEAEKIEASSDNLNIGDNITEVKTVPLDDDDLPTILAQGTFQADDGDDFDYKQKLTFDDRIQFSHWTDSEYMDKEPTLGIRIPKNQLVVTYKLDFTKSAESDVDTNAKLEDLEDASITMLGNKYDIVEATNATNIKLELMGGATKDILEQGQIKSYTVNDKNYEVEVLYIGTTGGVAKVKFKINGEVTSTIQEGATHKLKDGTQIGVREILEEEAGEVTADQVEFYIGAEKLTLENGQEMEMNDEDIDNMDVGIDPTFTTTTKINSITINWTADDDLFVTEDNSPMIPGLESFKLSYEGLTTVYQEELSIEDGGDDVLELKAMFEDGAYTIDLLGSNGTGGFDAIGGDGANEGLPTVAGVSGNMMYNLTDGNEDQYFVATYKSTKAGESYLLEISKTDDTDGVTFKNVITGQVVEEDVKNNTAFTIGSATITMNNFVEDVWVNLTAGANTYFDRIVTKEGLYIYLPVDSAASAVSPNINLSALPATYVLYIQEEDDSNNIGLGNDINFTLGHTTDFEVKVTDLTPGAKALLSGADYYEIGDTDEFVGYEDSSLGTKVLVDKGPDQVTAKLIYHGEEAYGNVYVAETEAGFGKVSGSSGTSVCKVAVPPAMLDSEVASISAQNWIGVGGPCANGAVAEVMGVPSTIPECLAGFEEGKAMIKLYEMSTGKTAMVVAGATALDTRRATRVLSNYDDYAISGDEVEVTGTSLSDISVSVVS